MARFSEKKPLYMVHIANAFLPIARLSTVSTEVDKLATAYAVKAIECAQRWTRDTRELSRLEVATNTALLEQTATMSDGILRDSLLSYALALKSFIACQYRDAIVHADNAERKSR